MVILYKVKSPQKKVILVRYINCKGNKGIKNDDVTTKNQKGEKGFME